MKALKHPGNLIIIGFVCCAVALLSLVYATTKVNFDMAVEGDYYQQEVAYNQQLIAEKRASAFGTAFNFTATGNKLKLELPSDLSTNLSKGVVEFYCLSDSKKDTRQHLPASADGVYIFDRSNVAAGKNYLVKVNFESQGKTYYKSFSMQ
jgi:hypothetical protein